MSTTSFALSKAIDQSDYEQLAHAARYENAIYKHDNNKYNQR
jgi:hypothetical protein